MQEVLIMTCTGNFYFSILLPGREIYFLGLLYDLPLSSRFGENVPIENTNFHINLNYLNSNVAMMRVCKNVDHDG